MRLVNAVNIETFIGVRLSRVKAERSEVGGVKSEMISIG